tara:strand:- start:109 stop:609 length:501 start_codon:yes stop_codon:yes gene_type:complete
MKLLAYLSLIILVSGCVAKADKFEIIDGPPISNESTEKKDEFTTWGIGSVMLANTVCKDEHTITRVAMADSLSMEMMLKQLMEFYSATPEPLCVKLPFLAPAKITGHVLEYTDHGGYPSVILKILLSDDGPEVFALALGHWREEDEPETKKEPDPEKTPPGSMIKI